MVQLTDMRRLMDTKIEATIPCTGRPGFEHVWMEGHLNTNNQYIIHLCERKDGKYKQGRVFLRPEELEELRAKIIKIKKGATKP